MVNNAKGGLEIVLLSYWKEREYVSAKQDRQGVRTASDLEQKYNFDKTFAELMGIATDARDKVDKVESTLRNEMKEQSTTISRDTEKIIMSALEEYVKTGDLEEYKKTVASELKVMADNISATVTSTEEQLTEVTDTVSGQVTAFEEYKSTNASALEVLDNKISANLKSTEEKITEVLDELDGQVALIEEYKQSTESDLSVMNEQISMSISSTSEQITAINQGLGEATAELEQQAMDMETLREQTESELLLLSDKLQLNFETATEQISSVNGEVQSVAEELEKHFEFSTDGLIIRAGENSMELHLDNDTIRFMKNGQEFGWWDGVDFHTGNVVVEVNERAQFGDFAFVPRSNGSLSFLKVGG